jgi:polar amino acid transport system substrate-binding protein
MKLKSRIFTALAVACTFAMVLCMTGCDGLPQLAPSQSSNDLPAQTVDDSDLITPGTLTIGLDYSNAPFAGESEGRVVGIDADVGAALAQELGLKAEFVDVGTGGGPNAVATKQCDVFLSFDRADSTDSIAAYAGTYMYDAASLFTISSNSSSNASYTDANGKKIAAQKSRSTAELVRGIYGDSSLVEEDTLVKAFSDLEDGSVQYVAAGGVVGSYIATSYEDIEYYCPLESAHEIGAGVSSDNTTLRSKVSSALSTLSQNGTIDVIISRWIGQPLNLNSSSVPTPSAAATTTGTDETSSTSTDGSTTSSTTTSTGSTTTTTGNTSTTTNSTATTGGSTT